MNFKTITLLVGLALVSTGAVAQTATPPAECAPPTAAGVSSETARPWWASGFSSEDALTREMRGRGFIIRGTPVTQPAAAAPSTSTESRAWWASGFASDADLEREMRGRGLMIGRPVTATPPLAGRDAGIGGQPGCVPATPSPGLTQEPMAGAWGSG